MDLRNELKPKQKSIDVNLLKQLIDKAETLYLEANPEHEVILQQINNMLPSGKKTEIYDICHYYEVCSLDEFVENLLFCPPELIQDITKEEVLTIIKQILDNPTSADTSFYLNLLEKNFPNGNACDLVFNPDVLGYDLHINLNAEQIADIIFNSK